MKNATDYFLGLFGYGPNPSAALLKGGRIVAIAEEERFNRIKTSPHSLPISAAMYCLREAGITLQDVAAIGFGWDCQRYWEAMPSFYDRMRKKWPVEAEFDQGYYEDYLLSVYNPKKILTDLRLGFAWRGHLLDECKVVFLPHHLCHCASTYFASGFDDAALLSVDGSGEEMTTLLATGKGGVIEPIEHFDLPDTLGGFFATFTEFLGFIPNQDEGKLMGLAPYGKFSRELQDKLGRILQYDPDTGDYSVNPRYRYLGRRTYGRLFTDSLVDLFGMPRLSSKPIEDRHRDIAFAVQWRLEEVIKALVKRLIRKTGIGRVCLAGGVAMNCKMNGVIAGIPEVSDIYVQPASADNGISLGAAYLMAQRAGVPLEPMEHAYWGPSFSDDEVESALKEAKLDYRRCTNAVGKTVDYLCDGRIVGWFQGRMEVGARALGGRSILANPLILDMRDKLNLEVKHRESWRPFCPSLPIDDYPRYFGNKPTSDYMILAFEVERAMQSLIPAVVHVDGSARPQTVRRESNPKFYDLLKAFGRKKGHPVLVNTSFNIQGEPIVCTPREAIRCFGGTGIDVLVLNDFITVKPGVVAP
jgi:carbamoyltransferase